jgi:hypothetical protein
LHQIWNRIVPVAETKSIHAVTPIAPFVIEYQYYLLSNVCIHFKRKLNTSQSSHKHENYSALLQGNFSLVSSAGKRIEMICLMGCTSPGWGEAPLWVRLGWVLL